jgi:hypothetical protein
MANEFHTEQDESQTEPNQTQTEYEELQKKYDELQTQYSELKTHPEKPLFLYISIVKFVLVSIFSLGIYEVYWIYKNWCYIKERDNLNILPFWRAVFGVFFIHSLLNRIFNDKDAGEFEAPSFDANALATGWVIVTILSNLLSRLPGAIGYLVLFIPAFIFLIPVQKYINSMTTKRNPYQEYYGWTLGQVLCIIYLPLCGLAGFILGLAGLM